MKLIWNFLREQLFDPDEGNCFGGIKNANQEIFVAEKSNKADFLVRK